MKLTLDPKSFVEAISWATKNYDSKDSNAYVALVVDKNGKGHLFHSNSTAYLRAPFQVIDSEFTKEEIAKGTMSLALEGQYLKRLEGALSSVTTPFELSRDFTNDASTVNLKTANGKFTLPLLAVKVATEPTIISLGEVDDREYFDSLQRLSKLCDAVNAGFLPALGAVAITLNVDEKKIALMATDRYALGEITLSYDPTNEAPDYIKTRNGKDLLLPVELATLIAPSKGLTSSTTLVHEPKGQKFGYQFGDGRVAVFSLKDAEPLAYLRLKAGAAKDVTNSLTISTTAFKTALATVANLSWAENEIYLDITEGGGLVVRDLHGTNKISVAVNDLTVDRDYTVKFVRSIINEAFHPVSTAQVKLKWKVDGTTYLLEPILDDGTVQDNVFVFFISSM